MLRKTRDRKSARSYWRKEGEESSAYVGREAELRGVLTRQSLMNRLNAYVNSTINWKPAVLVALGNVEGPFYAAVAIVFSSLLFFCSRLLFYYYYYFGAKKRVVDWQKLVPRVSTLTRCVRLAC